MGEPLIDSTALLISWDDDDPAESLDVVMVGLPLRDTVTELAVPLTGALVGDTFDALARTCARP